MHVYVCILYSFTAHLNTDEPDQFSDELSVQATVVKISDGKFKGTMGMVAGSTVQLGQSVVSPRYP